MSTSRNTNDHEHHRRRSSVTPLPLNSLLTRAKGTPGAPSSPFPIPTTATNDQPRRMSISTLGLSGTPPAHSPCQYFLGRRVSVCSSSSEAIDESAIDDDDASRPTFSATFPRRMSMGAQAIRSARVAGNSGHGGGLNVSEQFKYRAESTVSQAYQPPLSSSPNLGQNTRTQHHRANSVSEMMPAPVNPVSTPVPVGSVRRSPDAFQERILKGDFYMD